MAPLLPYLVGGEDLAAMGSSPIVRELQRDPEVRLLQQRDDRLEIVLLLPGDAQLVALDLRLHPLGPLVADLLADRLRLVGLDALDDLAVDLVRLAGRPGLPRVQRLQRDAALDQLLLETLQGGAYPILGLRLHGDRALAGPLDLAPRPPEVEPRRDLLLRLVKRVVDLLTVDLADDVERRRRSHPATPLVGFHHPPPACPTHTARRDQPVCRNPGAYRYPCLRCRAMRGGTPSAGCPSGQWERSVKPSRKLQRFESSTRHSQANRPLTSAYPVRGRSDLSGGDPAVCGCSWAHSGNADHARSYGDGTPSGRLPYDNRGSRFVGRRTWPAAPVYTSSTRGVDSSSLYQLRRSRTTSGTSVLGTSPASPSHGPRKTSTS